MWGIFWVAVAIIVAKVLRFVTRRWIKHFAAKTKTKLDDKIVQALELPIYYVVLLVGLYFALLTVLPAEWRGYVDITVKVLGVLIVGKAVKNILLDVLLLHYVDRLPFPKETKDRILSVKGMLDTVVYVVITLIALSAVGVDVWPILTPLGISGVAVAFAVKDVVSNYVAGIILVTEKQFKKGQRILVKEKGIEGTIVTVGWRSVHIRTDDGEDVFIPNSVVLNSSIVMRKKAKK